MRFYRATRFLFPRHYERRLLVICFLAVHGPLAAFVAWQAMSGLWNWQTLLVLLAATLASAIGGTYAISALLSPVGQATDLLGHIHRGEPLDSLPEGGDDAIGRLLGAVGLAANETARRIDHLVDAAERDPLTGLRNRRGFMDAVEPALATRQRSVIALIDLDRFKMINDVHGHERGDQLLATFGEHLSATLRRTDISARWGGEEFAVLFPNTSLQQAYEIVDRLRESTAASETFQIDNDILTFSSGLAPMADANDLTAALRQADEALYAAKASGRNQIIIRD